MGDHIFAARTDGQQPNTRDDPPRSLFLFLSEAQPRGRGPDPREGPGVPGSRSPLELLCCDGQSGRVLAVGGRGGGRHDAEPQGDAVSYRDVCLNREFGVIGRNVVPRTRRAGRRPLGPYHVVSVG